MAYKNHKEDKYCKDAGIRLQEGACGRGIEGADSLEWASGALNEDIWDDEEEEESALYDDGEIVRSSQELVNRRNIGRVIHDMTDMMGNADTGEDIAAACVGNLVSAPDMVSRGSSSTWKLEKYGDICCMQSFRMAVDTGDMLTLLDAGRDQDRDCRIIVRSDDYLPWKYCITAPLPVCLVEDSTGRAGGSLGDIAADGVRWLHRATSRRKYKDSTLKYDLQRNGVPYCTIWDDVLHIDFGHPADRQAVYDAVFSGRPLEEIVYTGSGGYGGWSMQVILCRVMSALLNTGGNAGPAQTVELRLASSGGFRSRFCESAAQYLGMNVLEDTGRSRVEAREYLEEYLGKKDSSLTQILLQEKDIKDLIGLHMHLADRRQDGAPVQGTNPKLAGMVTAAWRYSTAAVIQAFFDEFGNSVLSYVLDLFEQVYGYQLPEFDARRISGIKYKVFLDGKDVSALKQEMTGAVQAFNADGVQVIDENTYQMVVNAKIDTARDIRHIEYRPRTVMFREYTARAVPADMLYDVYMSNSGGAGGNGKKRLAESSLEAMADRLYEDIWDDEEEEEAAAKNTAAADDETYSRETIKGSGELGSKTLHRMLEQYSKEIDTSCGFYRNDENAVLTGVIDCCPYSVTASDKYNFFVQAQRKDSGTISFDGSAESLIIQNNESHGIKNFKMMPSVILSEITDETDNVRKKSVVYNDAFYSIMPCTVMIAAFPEKCANNEFTKYARIHSEIDEYFDMPIVIPPACGIYPKTGCGLFSDAPVNSTEHYGASFHNILREILLQTAMQDGKFCLDYIVPDWQMKFFSRSSYRNFNILTEYTGSIIWCDNAFRRKYRLNTDSGSIRLKDYLTGARQNLRAMRLLSSLMLYDIAVYMNIFADTVSDVLNSLADSNQDNLYYVNSLVGGASVSGSFTVNGKMLDQCAADRDAALAEIRNNGLNLLINMDGQGTGPMHSKIYRFTAEPITADR